MTLSKNDKISDAVADLYRASYYLAKKSKKTALSFLFKSRKGLGKMLRLDASKIAKESTLKSSYDYNFWAEKILDEYKRLKFNLSPI